MVQRAGGSWNAVTVGEKTSFFFSVPVNDTKEDTLDTILEVFASYFDHPLFDSKYCDREILAVDSEHSKNVGLSSRISFHGLKLLATKDHQFSRFSTGNFATLHAGNMCTRLISFFEREYKPDRMALVIKGPQSLNKLQRLVNRFASIGSASRSDTGPSDHLNVSLLNIASDIWKPRYSCFPFQDGGSIVHIQSAVPSLRIFFPYEAEGKHQAILEGFWCHLIGSETSGGLSSKLMAAEQVTEVVARARSICSGFRALQIDLSLTQTGSRNIHLIIESVFSYLAILDNSKRLAKSIAQCNEIDLYNYFHCEESSSSLAEVRSLSEQLLDPQKSLGNWFFKHSPCYDYTDSQFGNYEESKQFWLKQAIKFQRFTSKTCQPSNCYICELGPTDATSTDPYFKFKYAISKLPPVQLNSGYSIPPPNPFLPPIDPHTLLKAMESTGSPLGFAVNSTTHDRIPEIEKSGNGCEFWVKREYDVPFEDRAFVSVELTSQLEHSDANHVIALEILCQLVKTHLQPELYPALVIGYSYEVLPSLRGDAAIVIQVSGPKPKIMMILTRIIRAIKKVIDDPPTMVQFRKARVQVQKKFDTGEHFPSHILVSLGLMAIMEEKTWLIEERVDTLQYMNLAAFNRVSKSIFDLCYLSGLIHGDIDSPELAANQVLGCVSLLVTNLGGSRWNIPSTIKLPINSNYVAKSTCHDRTSALSYFVQTGLRRDSHSRAMTKFAAFVMASTLLHKLRVQYQLGYVVMIGMRVFRKVHGIHITLMSGQLSPQVLESKVEGVIMEWSAEMRKLSTSKFQALTRKFDTANQQMVAAGGPVSLTQTPTPSNSRLMSRHQGYWDQIVNRSYRFSQNGEDAMDTDLHSLTKDQFLGFLKQYILPTSDCRRKVSAMLQTELAEKDAERMLRPMQLYTFLTAVGLPIMPKTLQQIMDNAGDSKVQLYKNLFGYYRSQGRSLKMVAGLAKLSALLAMSSEAHGFQNSSETEIDIDHLQEWQDSIGYL